MNNTANFRQFQLIRYINENCDDEHVMSKISIVLRRDKIEAPYYMVTKIRLSTCVDAAQKGMIHAMDVLNHQRMYNLSREKYNEIESLINDCAPSDCVKILREDRHLKMLLTSRNDEELRSLFKTYGKLFDVIDNLID